MQAEDTAPHGLVAECLEPKDLPSLEEKTVRVGLSGIAQNFDPEDPDDVARIEAFFELEDRLMAEGVIDSDFVTVTAVRD